MHSHLLPELAEPKPGVLELPGPLQQQLGLLVEPHPEGEVKMVFTRKGRVK